MHRRLTRRQFLRATLGAGIAAGMGAIAYGLGFWPPQQRSAERLRLIAHHGDVANWPENSLESLVSAARLGADGIEVDVVPSAAGTWWAIHEVDVSRTTNGTGLSINLPDTELARLTISGGVGFDRRRHGDVRLARFADILEALADYEGLVYADMKWGDDRAHEKVAEQLVASRLPQRCAMICQSMSAVAAVKAVEPVLRTLVLHDAGGQPRASEALDAWLAPGGWFRRPDQVATLPYELEMFTYAEEAGIDESLLIERAHRWNATAFLTHDLPRALAIRERLESA